MARVTMAPARRRRKAKVFDRAKGFYGRQSKVFRVAAHRVKRALAFAYDGRKIKKRDYRALWNIRISAAAKLNDFSYSRLIHGLHTAGVEIDRKVLADIAVHDPVGFKLLVDTARG